jgi:CheY-like chemotaxis protein
VILPAAASSPPILLAEDDPDDVLLMQIAAQKAGLPNPLFVVSDGQETVDYLGGKDLYSNRQSYPLPSLLLLDLKMPRLSGFDVLAWLQEHPEFNDLPIVVLSGSDLEKDIQKAKELGADDYRIKPAGTGSLVKMLHELYDCWLDGHLRPASEDCDRTE